jgi:hypothetical protein
MIPLKWKPRHVCAILHGMYLFSCILSPSRLITKTTIVSGQTKEGSEVAAGSRRGLRVSDITDGPTLNISVLSQKEDTKDESVLPPKRVYYLDSCPIVELPCMLPGLVPCPCHIEMHEIAWIGVRAGNLHVGGPVV